MALIHSLGNPRIGPHRELKTALEAYWKKTLSAQALEETAKQLRQTQWKVQKDLDFLTVGDFSLYDHVLDMSFTLGNLPERVRTLPLSALDQYFTSARGGLVPAGEMTKWFTTNYHYIVPEFHADTVFQLNPHRLLSQLREAQAFNRPLKIVLVGPVTYLALGKADKGFSPLSLLPRLLPLYQELLTLLAAERASWVQMDEPLLCRELTDDETQAFRDAYQGLKSPVPLLLTTYFGRLAENFALVQELPVAGLHLDALNAEAQDVEAVWPLDKVLSLGVLNGRNIWKADLKALLTQWESAAQRRGDRLWLAPTSSLLHVPHDLNLETALPEDLKPRLAFAYQKIHELTLLARGFRLGTEAIAEELQARVPKVVPTPRIAEDLPAYTRSPYEQRQAAQVQHLRLPLFPTTTIGSFPQTDEIRRVRRLWKLGQLSDSAYQHAIQDEIALAVSRQEELGLDVLVHGEAERGDMVEYFGEQLEGFAFTNLGWVQSYGSRCVKPPILYTEVQRPQPMTVSWITYAQSLTSKPVKGMLTGPVTILNWSFVREDQPREQTCRQIALALRKEVLDLEKAGVQLIQIDEAAFKEGMPLRREEGQRYLDEAVRCFRLTAGGVSDTTQIHTHMCYSDFRGILPAIAAMDADVLTVETSKSGGQLWEAFQAFPYPNEVGPGVYDIHSPRIPPVEEMVRLLREANQVLPSQRLWVNPDCGLKTRQWSEVTPSLANLVAAAKVLRESLRSETTHVS